LQRKKARFWLARTGLSLVKPRPRTKRPGGKGRRAASLRRGCLAARHRYVFRNAPASSLGRRPAEAPGAVGSEDAAVQDFRKAYVVRTLLREGQPKVEGPASVFDERWAKAPELTAVHAASERALRSRNLRLSLAYAANRVFTHKTIPSALRPMRCDRL
jgi:hypothetical protein